MFLLSQSCLLPGLIPALHSSQARRLHAVVTEGLGVHPFPWWCGMSVITLSAVEGTSVLPLGLHILWSKSLTGSWALSGLQEVGILCPSWSVWCDVLHGMAWQGVPVGVLWCALAQPVLVPPATCKALPEWEWVGGSVCLARLS